MKAEELRIGNLIVRKDLISGLDRIEAIIEIGQKLICSGPIKVICEYDEIKPIPLTEEWLLKFGFEQETEKGIKLNWWNLPKDNSYRAHHLMKMQNTWTWFINFTDDEENPNCLLVKGFNYVHELQNLCFALTETELTIK